MAARAQARYCVVGAGAAGLAAAKNLKARGIPFEVLEREDEVGGLWNYGRAHSAVYASTHLISSKPMTEFPDFPMPDDYPDYPHHRQVLAYLKAYARHFGLYEHIAFKTTVQRLEPGARGWQVTTSGPAGREVRRYRGVIIANGHLWDPRYPRYPGTFDGQVLHSKDYKTPEVLKGKRVLVVGAGNSGCDIAVEAAQHAERAFHSLRRGYHFIPKYLFGLPTDQVGERSLRLGLPLGLRRLLTSGLIYLVQGSPQRFGLPKPDHRLLESHPIVNSQLVYQLGHGNLTPKPDVAALDGSEVRFADGSTETIDLIIYATGFKLSFPFINKAQLNWQGEGPRLYLHAFHPQYDTLFVVGMLQPDSGLFWLMDTQCQLIARFIEAQEKAPQKAARFRALKAAGSRELRESAYLPTLRHFLETEHSSYKRKLQRLIASFDSR